MLISSGNDQLTMSPRKSHKHTFTGIWIGVILIIGLGILSIARVGNTNFVRAEGNAEATDSQTPASSQPAKASFANALTQLAAPTATEGTDLSPTATSTLSIANSTASSIGLNESDALATITAQQVQIKALQDQLASAQGDKGATLYAVVIIAIGALLAFAVFFGLKRG